MALYTFYLGKPDGTSESLVTFDLRNDGEALFHALQILEQHPGASQVVAWCGERKAVTRTRVHPDLRAVLTQIPGNHEATERRPG